LRTSSVASRASSVSGMSIPAIVSVMCCAFHVGFRSMSSVLAPLASDALVGDEVVFPPEPFALAADPHVGV
jgi:hypothetical protein